MPDTQNAEKTRQLKSVLDSGSMKRLGGGLPDSGEDLFSCVILHVLAWCLFLLGMGYAIF